MQVMWVGLECSSRGRVARGRQQSLPCLVCALSCSRLALAHSQSPPAGSSDLGWVSRGAFLRLERRGLPAVSCDVDTAVSSRASMLGLTSSRLLSPTQYRAPAGSFDLERASRGAILRWDRRRTIGGRGVKGGPSVQKTRFDESPLFLLLYRSREYDPEFKFKLNIKLEKRGEKKKEREAIRQNAWTNVKLESV